MNNLHMLWEYIKPYFWLELKKWSRITTSTSYSTLLSYGLISLASLTFLNLNLYKPLWQHNTREVAIGGLLVLFLGLMFLTSINAIFPTDETGVLLPLNPFHFTSADLNAVTLSAGRPLAIASLGWFRTSVKSCWFCFLLSSIILSYCLEFQIPLTNFVFVVFLLFIAFQTILLSGSFVYTITEEIIEKMVPLWREHHFNLLRILTFASSCIIVLGGMVIIGKFVEGVTIRIEEMVINYWFLPPFNIIYVILTLLSRTWTKSLFFPALFTVFVQWFIVTLSFFLVIGNIDPLARLHERKMLVSYLEPPQIPFPHWIERYLRHLSMSLQISDHQFTRNVFSLFGKDFLLCWKYRQFLGYIGILIFTYGAIIVSFLMKTDIDLLFFLPALIWSYVFVFILWKFESKSLIKNLNITMKSLILEKWLFGFVFVIELYFPILILSNGFFFTSAFIVYHSVFILGLLHFYLSYH